MKYDLERFVTAQKLYYRQAFEEMKRGRKRGHWIWFIFPQHYALGQSTTAIFYGISGLEEAKEYLAHPILGHRLREISAVMLENPSSDPLFVMGSPDDLKLRSCMTLFARATEDNEVFRKVLDKFYGGEEDGLTVSLLEADD